MNGQPSPRFVLRDLGVAPRLVIALFLVSVGIGYFSALAQLHFQNASAGRLLPDPDDAVIIYSGRKNISQLERVLVTDENRPFNGSGTMRPAFFEHAGGWKGKIKKKAKERNLSLIKAETELREERNGERLAMLAWIRAGADEKAYENDSFDLPADLTRRPITDEFLETDANNKKTGRIKIRKLIQIRCEHCHAEGAGGQAGQYPLDTYERIHDYLEVETAGGGMSLKKLAQSTHVHLLAFSILYALTGLIFAFTSFPSWMRLLLSPLPLLAQIADISCWWLARVDDGFARVIVVTGTAVGASLGLQIFLSLFNMFGKVGRIVLVILILLAAFGGYAVKVRWIEPYLQVEASRGGPPE